MHLNQCLGLVSKQPLLTQVQRDGLRHHYRRRHWAMLAEAARRNPDRPEVQLRLTDFLVTCPDPKYRDAALAVELGKRVTAARPDDGAAWGLLGVAQARTGAWKEAVASIEKALRFKKVNDCLLSLALAHWHLGDHEQARRRYEEGVRWVERFAANEPWLVELRAEVESLLGPAPARK
jgi:Flp pilus assembly protein TadD